MDRDDFRTQDSELDYRFTLANGRTFLAWIRTSFGLVTGGVAVDQLVIPSAVRTVAAIGCLALAVFALVPAITSHSVRGFGLYSSPDRCTQARIVDSPLSFESWCRLVLAGHADHSPSLPST